jgi:UDP-N-acetylmuramoyl-tripeptide--D-alanyl-D-alanine ligase
MRIALRDIIEWGGITLVAGDDDVMVEGATADSRDVVPGCLFVGVSGENEDGGLHAADAIAQGAVAVLVGPEAWSEVGDDLARTGAAILLAGDPIEALGLIGRGALQHLGARVVGVTGSYGKTSTKDSVGAVLLAAGVRVACTPGNRNTEVGVPLSILGLPADAEVAVIEMGMRGPGQIAELAVLAPPDVAVITSVGPVHLELLGTIEAIAAAKAEILGALRPGGVAVIPDDDSYLSAYVDALPEGVGVVRFGDEPAIDLDLGDLKAWERRNMAAAVAVATALGTLPAAGTPVRLVRSAMRGIEYPLPGGGMLIEDCYNANPPAMGAALADLCRREGRHVAVMADMLELGPDEARFHREVGEEAARLGVDLVIAVGARAASYPDGADGVTSAIFATTDDAVAGVPALIEPGDVVLVKGSRGMAMERVARAIREREA